MAENFNIDNLPIDSLLLGNPFVDGEASKENNGFIHQNIYCAGKKKFNLHLPVVHSSSIVYYLPKDSTTQKATMSSFKSPNLYAYPVLHPAWSNVDENNKITREKSTNGTRLEKFFDSFRDKCEELVRKLPVSEFRKLAGQDALVPSEQPLNMKYVVHPIKYAQNKNSGTVDDTKSSTLELCIWTGKRNENIEIPENNIRIPGTDKVIFTSFYDNTKKNKDARGIPAKDYSEIIKYIHSADDFIVATGVNASKNRCDMLVSYSINAPTLLWNKKAGGKCSMKMKVTQMVVLNYLPTERVRIIPLIILNELDKEKEKMMIECGIERGVVEEEEAVEEEEEEKKTRKTKNCGGNENKEDDYDNTYEKVLSPDDDQFDGIKKKRKINDEKDEVGQEEGDDESGYDYTQYLDGFAQEI